MEFRTSINIEPSKEKIGYDTHAMFVGSCFSSYIGKKFENTKMPVMVNPSGTVYNPCSVATTLNSIIDEKIYDAEDIGFFNGKWFSFDHYTDFSMADKDETVRRINDQLVKASEFLKKTSFLFITFGTARVFRHIASGRIVSNCHKIPAMEFSREMLIVDDIVGDWKTLLTKIKVYNPNVKVVFTVSPVRHWKDGAHGNQLSKAVLLLAIEKLMEAVDNTGYFPSYEIMMDDLRDYRYYADDMLHPSDMAVSYIWELFSGRYFDDRTKSLHRDFERLAKAMSHRQKNGSYEEKRLFAVNSLKIIDRLESGLPSVDFAAEREYFGRF